MKFFENKICLLFVLLLGITFTSCEEDDSGSTDAGEPLARFTFTIDVQTINFINISENSNTYMWDFGDGSTSNLINPVKEFENGTYTVILTAYDNNGNSSTFQDTITIDVPVCVDETSENLDPANGDLNWTFLTENESALFSAFGDTSGEIVANPILDDVNSSCNVEQFIKVSGCQTFAGLGKELNTPLDFTDPNTSKIFKMKVLAQSQVTEVTLRLEFMPFPNVNPFQERIASITQVGEWQTLTFDFSEINVGTYKSVIIYFERDAPCDGDIYYFDDLRQE
ncbi:PKD domain-containing protein [Psychroflexus aestuariivivens]|uniref:PKD domain-containing protein n=1 Tax=Psychroflexus aestuariivivens TaxID=1795040 RepID=UPI000FD82091|nr:PKD domain-containing protein [Psychroflexus aestuariivivens]